MASKIKGINIESFFKEEFFLKIIAIFTFRVGRNGGEQRKKIGRAWIERVNLKRG